MVATITVLAPANGSYEQAVVSKGPLAYWRFNETSGTTAFDYVGGHDATYVNTATPGAEAPRSPQFPGFEANNLAVQLDAPAPTWADQPADEQPLSLHHGRLDAARR